MSGISYGVEFEVVRAAVRVGVPPSTFQSWPVEDQCKVIACLRTEARIEAILAEEAGRQARQRNRAK